MAGFVLKLNADAVAGLTGGKHGPALDYLEKIAARTERNAKLLCPVDTGRLRASITHEVTVENGKPIGRVGSSVTYASYLELGTRKMRARPFLRPALSAAEGSDQQATAQVSSARAAHASAAKAARATQKKAATAKKVQRNVKRSQTIRRKAQAGRFLP